MPGIFSKANRPKLPGAYFNFQNQVAQSVPAAPGSVCAIIFTHDWGPLDIATRCSSFSEFQAIFGDSDDTDGFLAVKQAFLGENLEGRNGAGEVVALRIAGSAAASSAITINKTGGGAGITLTAVYKGTIGNDLTATVSDAAGSTDRLTIYKGSVEVERYEYTQTDITDLAAQINEFSDWVVASGVTSGTALDQATDGPLISGNDGTTLVNADWTDGLDVLETESFGVFAPAACDTSQTGLLAAFVTWVQDANDAGKRFCAVFGGLAGETISTAATRSGACADPNILNVGGITLTDEVNGPDGGEVELGGKDLAPRVAGILAARGEYGSITAARLANTTITVGPSLTELVTAFDEGVVTLARDSHSVAPVYIAVGLNTFTDSDADDDRPYLTYRQPKYIRTMQGIETELTQFAVEHVIGLASVGDNSRDALVAECKRNLAGREAQGSIQPGWTVGIDQDPPPTSEDEFIALAISIEFGRALEQVYFTVSVG